MLGESRAAGRANTMGTLDTAKAA